MGSAGLSLEIMMQVIWEDIKILCELSYVIFFSLLGKCGGMGSFEGVWVLGSLSTSIQGAVGGIQKIPKKYPKNP